MGKRSNSIVAVAAFAAFLATFNETYLNVAFAPIMADLGITVAVVQWLATAYMLGAAVMIPVSAFAYRSIPTKPLFLFTVALFIIGSLIGATAQTFSVLLAGRIIQALGTGLLIPIGMNITLEVAPREKLGIYMGLMGAMTTLGPSLSVVAAGGLLNFFDWHILLWVFAGLSCILFLVGALLLHNVAKLTRPKLDALSVALVCIAFTGILYGIATVFSGNKNVAAATAFAGIVFLAMFVSRQRKLSSPLIDLVPLSVKPFRIGVIINMLSLVTLFAMNIIIPIFMQSVLGVSSLTASLTLFPAIALCCIISPLAGRIYDKHGAKFLLPLGFILIAVFSVLLALFISTSAAIMLALLYIPVIGGSALIIGPVQSLALSHLAPEKYPHGVTVLSTGFQIAGCLGASLFTSVYFGVTTWTGGNAGTGFLAVGFLTALFALIGLAFALVINGYKRNAASHSANGFLLNEIMKTDVYSLSPANRVSEAMRLFIDKKISAAPIVENGIVIGFISDGDILRHLEGQHTSFKNAWSFIAESDNADFNEMLKTVMQLPIMEIAVKNVVCIDVNTYAGDVCKILVENNLRKAPVVKEGRLIGIINLSNINKYSMNAYLKTIK